MVAAKGGVDLSTYLRHTEPGHLLERTFQPFLRVYIFGGLTLLLVLLPMRPLIGLIGLACTTIFLIRWPWLIWVGLGIVLPVTSGIKLGPLSLTDLILMGGFVLWFVDGVRQRRLRVVPHPLTFMLALFAGVLYFSLLQATDLREAVAEIVKWVQFSLVLLIVPAMLPRTRVQWLVVALLVGGIFQGLFGLYQFIFRIGPEWFIILEQFMRASGTFNQPNPYAGYLGLCLPVAISMALWSFDQWFRQPAQSPTRNRTLLLTLFYMGASATILLGLLLSWSRGGWLGAICALVLVSTLHSRNAAIVSGAMALLIGATILLSTFGATSFGMVLIPAPITERFEDIPAYLGLTDVLNEPLTTKNFAVVERVAHWVAALRMWDRAPWLGVGPGNYATIYPEVRLPFWKEPLGHAHNIYLNLLAESGLLGLTIYLLLWFAILRWLWQQRQSASSSQDWTVPLIIGVIGVVGHLSIHNFFDNLFVQGSYLHIALWLAAVQAKSFTGRQ